MPKKAPTIDNVTITNLDLALRMCGYKLKPELIDKIIDLVELIEKKGDNTNLKDLSKLFATWD